MTTKHAALAAAIAAVLAAPAFAQGTDCTISSTNLQSNCSSTSVLGAGPATLGSTTAVTNSSAAPVVSGTGVVVTPGAPSTSVAVVPSTSVMVPSTHLLPGAATVQASSTTVLGGPAGNVSGTQTVMTHYWVNVPADVEHRADFQRWTRLKP